eukprot:g1235.t1
MLGALLQQQAQAQASIAEKSVAAQSAPIQDKVNRAAEAAFKAQMARRINNFGVSPLVSSIDNAKRRRLDGKEPVKAPYFFESSKVAAATSSNKLDLLNMSSTTANGRKAPITKERQSIIDVLVDPQKTDAAQKQVEKLCCNLASQQVAASRLMTYKITTQVAGLQAWPATYQKIITFISACIAGEHPHKGVESMVSDVVNAAGKFPQDDKDRVRAVINRLKKKGAIGIREQKRPIALRHICIYSPAAAANRGPRIVQTRVELLIGFHGAFRRKEAAAMTFLGPLDETPRGYIGVRLDDVDKSLDAQAFVAAHEMRNENATLGREENILMGVVDMRHVLGDDQPTQADITKLSTMFRQKEFSRTGPTILTSSTMTLEKFLNGMACETKLGRIIQVDTAREAINHIKTYRLNAKEAGCETTKVEEWAAAIVKDATQLQWGPADQGRRDNITQLHTDRAALNARIASGELDAQGAPLQQPVPGFQQQIDTIATAARNEYGVRINIWVTQMFLPLMKQKVEEGIRYAKLQAGVDILKKTRPSPYSKREDLWCPEVPSGKVGKGKGGKGKGDKGGKG